MVVLVICKEHCCALSIFFVLYVCCEQLIKPHQYMMYAAIFWCSLHPVLPPAGVSNILCYVDRASGGIYATLCVQQHNRDNYVRCFQSFISETACIGIVRCLCELVSRSCERTQRLSSGLVVIDSNRLSGSSSTLAPVHCSVRHCSRNFACLEWGWLHVQGMREQYARAC